MTDLYIDGHMLESVKSNFKNIEDLLPGPLPVDDRRIPHQMAILVNLIGGRSTITPNAAKPAEDTA